jgi:Mn-dependent DtxR family transcriptional regulator
MNNKSTIDMIQECITWLDQNSKSNNLVKISQTIGRLSILSVSLGHDVSNAYTLASEFEDNYDIAFAERFSKLTKEGTSAAAAKPIVEAELHKEKRDWTSARNGYKRLSTFMDRVDRVQEAYRQLISVSKLDLKHN